MPVKELLNFSAIISLSVIDLQSTVRDSSRFSVGLDLIIVFITFQVCFMSLLYFVNCDWRPWVRRSLNANIEEEKVFKTCETWSVVLNLALRRTPRILSVVTLSAPSMNGCD